MKTALLILVAGHPEGKRVLCPNVGKKVFSGRHFLPLDAPDPKNRNTPALVRSIISGINLPSAIDRYVEQRAEGAGEKTVETDTNMLRICTVTLSWFDVEKFLASDIAKTLHIEDLDTASSEPVIKKFLEAA